MILRMILVIMAAALFAAGGCRKQPPSPAPDAGEVKITGENLDSELDKMEQEIESDVAAEQ